MCDDLNSKRVEISLHYDNLLWTVTTLFIGAVGGLLVYCWTNFDSMLASLGFYLTIAAVYFAITFRRLRRRVHKNLPTELSKILEARGPLKQWLAFQFIFIVLVLEWLWLLVWHEPAHSVWWYFAAALGIGFIILTRWSDRS